MLILLILVAAAAFGGGFFFATVGHGAIHAKLDTIIAKLPSR